MNSVKALVPRKKGELRTVEVVGYSHWANLLINHDDQGLPDSDLRLLASWLDANGVERLLCTDCSEEPEFARPDGIYGDSALPGECYTYTFLVR